MQLPIRKSAFALIASIVASPHMVYAAGDAARGRALARTWCSSCHTTERSAVGKDLAPSFPSIAERGRPDQLEAHAFLNSPHPPMPDFNLSRSQIDDILAYLKRLAEQNPPRGNRPP